MQQSANKFWYYRVPETIWDKLNLSYNNNFVNIFARYLTSLLFSYIIFSDENNKANIMLLLSKTSIKEVVFCITMK